MDPVRNDAQKKFEEFPGRFPVGFPDQLCDSEFACPVDGNEEVQLALGGLDLCDIEMKEPDQVAFEALSFWLGSLHVRKPGYPVTLKAAMQGRACQMRNAGLQRIKAVIQRQQGMPTKGYDHRFIRLKKNR
ncbi:hypothetical protein A0U89_15790 (plasmid) [Kozakia baliensis]|uniref:Uncharacterized protein n=1 Tax=Kozakia baliensis TaxID=153496 RepID=A0A1D8UYQ8_9PROT|nr:hypothetical protein A0U89_15790 [Kozakia baliensis]